MRKLLLLSTIAAAPPLAAHADLFTLGGAITIDGTNGADGNSFSNTAFLPSAPFVPVTSTGVQFSYIDNGLQGAAVYDIPTAGGGEWLVFDYQPINGNTPLVGNLTGSWKAEETNFAATVPINLDATWSSFTALGGINLIPSNGVFPGYSVMSDPIPDYVSFGQGAIGVGSTGFTSAIAAGVPLDFYASLDPFSQLSGDGIYPPDVFGFVQALHFDPQVVTTGVPEPGTLAILGVSLLGLVAARGRAA